jgi:hypothetical protein
MLQNARMVIIYIQNTVVYVLYVCRLAPENGRDTEVYSSAKNWEKLDSEIKLRRVLFFLPFRYSQYSRHFRDKIAGANVMGSILTRPNSIIKGNYGIKSCLCWVIVGQYCQHQCHILQLSY